MSNIERTITFQPLDPSLGSQQTRFTIEPPIDVHDPRFLNGAVYEAAVASGQNPAEMGDPDVGDVNLTYSDGQATNGTAFINGNEYTDTARQLITEGFESGLGTTALKLNFLEHSS